MTMRPSRSGCRRCQVCVRATCICRWCYNISVCAIFLPPLSPLLPLCWWVPCVYLPWMEFSFDDRLTLTLWLTALLTSRLGFKPSPSQRTLHSFDSQRLLAQSSEEISSVSSQYNDRLQTKLNNTRYNHWFFVPLVKHFSPQLTFFWLSSAPRNF